MAYLDNDNKLQDLQETRTNLLTQAMNLDLETLDTWQQKMKAATVNGEKSLYTADPKLFVFDFYCNLVASKGREIYTKLKKESPLQPSVAKGHFKHVLEK